MKICLHKRKASIFIAVFLAFYIGRPAIAGNVHFSNPYVGNKNINVKIDNVPVKFNTEPFVLDGNIVMVPIRETFAKLGYDVEWDAGKRTISALGNNGPVLITLEKDVAIIDEVEIQLPAKVQLINGVTMIPLCLVDDALKTSTRYDRDSNTVYIDMPAPYIYPTEIDVDEWMSRLPAGEPLVSDDALFQMKTSKKEYVKYRTVNVDINGQPYQALEIETKPLENNEIPENSYDLQMVLFSGINQDFIAGDVGLLSCYVRAVYASDESGYAFIRPQVEQNYGAWHKAGSQEFKVGEEWERIYVPLYNPTYSILAGASRVGLCVGYRPQIIQVADLKIVNFKNTVSLSAVSVGKKYDAYKGMEDDALWRKEALKRIERIRKNDVFIKVKDENGNPVSGTDINIKMKRNEFMFGTAVRPTVFDSKKPEYAQAVLKNFNTIVAESASKWTAIEKDDGAESIKLANWAFENNLYFRGHCLIWDARNDEDKGTLPVILQDYASKTKEEVWNIIEAHLVNTVLPYKGKIVQWDVVNEPYMRHKITDKFGIDLFAGAFNRTKELDPDVKTYLNEGRISADISSISRGGIKRMLKEYIDNGARIDGLGAETHFLTTCYPQHYYMVLDDLAQYVNEIAITEYDLNITDDEIAGKFLRDMLIMIYSHPKATAFIMWGFNDNHHWRRNAPLYYANYTPKPAYKYWEQYVLNEWMSCESGTTDENGELILRGHRGDYEISVEVGDKTAKGTFKLVKNSDDGIYENIIEITVGEEITIIPNNPASLPIELINGTTHTEAISNMNNNS